MKETNFAEIAQLVEQWIEDPRVTSSSLVLGILFSFFRILFLLDFLIFKKLDFFLRIRYYFSIAKYLKASLVQLVERRSPKSDVEGSSPSRRVK